MIRLLLIALVFLSGSQFVAAQATEEFTVRVFGAVDIVAPSTTTIQSILPIGSTQIDLSWATSTDNYTVFGYVVSRDGVSIATTTDTFYSDIGLTASTTYSYSVRAFDGVPNYSTSSPSVSTTTLDVPVVIPPDSNSISGTVARVVLESFSVEPGVTAAQLVVETKRPARVEVRIGRTTSYEIGYMAGNLFSRKHTIPVNNLQPSTTYYYELIGYTPSGAQTVLRRSSFVTLSDAPPSAPANVRLFEASVFGEDVQLSWEIPDNLPEGARVRIVGNHFGYPTFINDGVVVYEGVGNQVLDRLAFGQHDVMFYTAFIIDPNGLISSGAITTAARQTTVGGVSPEQPSFEGLDPEVPNVADPNVDQEEPEQLVPVGMPGAQGLEVRQDPDVYTFASTTIPLSGTESFSVSIAADMVVGDFKTIVATLEDPRGSGKTFSFLLRLNPDKTVYQAVIAPVLVPGDSKLTVEVYDYSSLVVARYSTTIVFSAESNMATSTFEVLLLRFSSIFWGTLLIVPFAVLALLWFIFWKRARDEDKIAP